MNILSDDGKSIVRLKSWEEVFERKFFKQDVNPKEVKLKSILGDYDFGTEDRCGLSSCKTKHKKGFLVQCEGFIETNIGHKCGKRYFGVDFEEQRANFTKDINARRFREQIVNAISKIPTIRQTIGEMLTNDGKLAFSLLRDLERYTFKGVAKVRLQKRSVLGDTKLIDSKQATERDIHTQEAISGRKLSDKEKENLTTQEVIGHIAGIRAFSSFRQIKEVLILELPQLLKDLAQVETEKLHYDQLKTWSLRVGGIDKKLQNIQDIIDDCLRFSTDSNVRLIKQFEHLL